MQANRLVLISIVLAGCTAAPTAPTASPTPRGAPAPAPAPIVEVNVKPGINDPYVNPDVTQWVERFEREGREIYEKRHEIVAACRIRPGSDVADIGAGTGLFVPLFADAVGPRGKVYAVEIVPEFIDLIAARAAGEGRRNVETVLCTERSVELPAASIDLAYICDVYHHFEYPKNSMTSLHRALRAGGEVIVIDFVREPGKSSDWILEHVRAGQDVVTREIESIGFELVEEGAFLESNYFLRFRRR